MMPISLSPRQESYAITAWGVGRISVALCLLLLWSAVYGPLLSEFWDWQWSRPHYRHFFLIPVAAVVLLLWRWSSAPAVHAPKPSGWRCFAFAVTSWIVMLAAVIIYSPLLAAMSAILLCGVLCTRIEAYRHVGGMWGIWALLWLVLPIPLGRDRLLMSELQGVSSWLASAALDMLGVLHVMEGNRLELVSRPLLVDEACSGIVSVLCVVHFAVIYAVGWRRSLVHVLTLGFLGIGLAVLLNVVRIVTIACALDWYVVDWTTGAAHDNVGNAALSIGIAGIGLCDLLLLALFAPIASEWQAMTGSDVRFGGLLVRAWDSLTSWGAAPRDIGFLDLRLNEPPPRDSESPIWSFRQVATVSSLFLALGVLNLLLPGAAVSHTPPRESELACVARALEMGDDVLPRELAGATYHARRIERRDRLDQLGEYSNIYNYLNPGSPPLLVSCDFPFRGGWHELSICYQGTGSELVRRQIVAAESSDGTPWNYVVAHFRTSQGEHELVAYSAFTASGDPLEPPATSLADSLRRALSRRQQRDFQEVSFQVQVVLRSAVPPSEARIEQIAHALMEVRDRVRASIVQIP